MLADSTQDRKRFSAALGSLEEKARSLAGLAHTLEEAVGRFILDAA